MHFMNEGDIDYAQERYARHPVLSRATRILNALKDLVNANSDGWAYWAYPVRAADKLMTLIESARDRSVADSMTEEDLKKAIVPLKTFLTRFDKSFIHDRHLMDVIRDTSPKFVRGESVDHLIYDGCGNPSTGVKGSVRPR